VLSSLDRNMSWLIDPPIQAPPSLRNFRNRSARAALAHALRRDIEQLTPSPPVSLALESATNRANAIDRFLRPEEEPVARSEPSLPAPAREFIELPPGLGEGPARELDEMQAFGQTARLRLQRNYLPFLLLERAIDAIVLWERRLGQRGTGDLRHTAVRLDTALDNEHAPRFSKYQRQQLAFYLQRANSGAENRLSSLWDEVEELYPLSVYLGTTFPDFLPYRIVVETDSEALRRFLLDQTLWRWLGVGIDLAPASPPMVPQVRCGVTSKTGTVGGFLEVEAGPNTGLSAVYAMTCAHVVGNCAVIKGDTRVVLKGADKEFPVLHQPDAALVDVKDCLCTSSQIRFGRKVSAPYSVTTAAEQHLVTSFLSPNVRRNYGYVESPRWAFKLDDEWHRYPSLAVRPLRSFLDRVIRPLNRQFSYPGDSGSWVVRRQAKSEWLGMLIGSVPENYQSFIADAQYLLSFFEQQLRSRHGSQAVITAVV
jgi:hypothetical protein